MANKHRGEVEAVLDGAKHRLVLTLNALAELEAAFGEEDMVALAGRFDSGRLKAADCVRIIGAGLRGAGYAISDTEAGNMQADGGAAGFVSIVAKLLAATFAGDCGASAAPAGSSPGAQGEQPGPFPGTA
ncbi:MAG TPA: gene transfer agent family protein [Hyphomicrobium sp.]|nr:gene transfer agent family protein [Hyphomicrobium sp.]